MFRAAAAARSNAVSRALKPVLWIAATLPEYALLPLGIWFACNAVVRLSIFSRVAAAPSCCYSFSLVQNHVDPENVEISDPVKWHKLAMRRHELEIAMVFRALLDNGIEPILVKGWAAARNYPEGTARNFGDIDLACSKADYPKAVKIVAEPDFPPSFVDLHDELRHYDRTPWSELFRRSITIEVEKTPIRTLRHEDHLRVICVHWLNDGGAYKERLWDIYYAVENRPPDFDWGLCLGTVSPTRRKWIITAIVLAHRHLGLRIDDLPLSAEDREIPEWIEQALHKEWATEVRLHPIHYSFRNPRTLIQQIRKRLPPNPIQSTIEAEGEFDDRSRLRVQLLTFFRRFVASLNRVIAGRLRRPAK